MPEGYQLIRDGTGTPVSSGILAVHAALLRDGRVLYFSGSQHDDRPLTLASARIFDPRFNMVQVANSPLTDDLFCCGHAYLPNGDLFVAGGTASYDVDAPAAHQVIGGAHHFVGIATAFTYRQASGTWASCPPMAEGRWYPSCVALPFGDVFVISGHGGPGAGHHENTQFELYRSPISTWSPPRQTNPPINDHGIVQIYFPRLHLMPNGKLFCSSAWDSRDGKRTRMVDPYTGTLTTLSHIPEGRHCDHVYKGANFSSALLPLEPPHYNTRIFICGGKFPRIFDMQSPGRGWQLAGGETEGRRPYDKRAYGNAVLLPDGSVLVINGCQSERGYPLSGGGTDRDAVLFAERYIPDAPYWPPNLRNTWERLSASPDAIARVYHSVALLLPDGRVWIAGSNHDSGRNRSGNSVDHPGTDARELRMEYYSPPYMDSQAARPIIASAPAEMGYGQPFRIASPDAARVERVSLLRAGSVTHSFDFDQRYVGLAIEGRSPDALTVKGPPHANIAPDGVYMVFLVDRDNVPSVGRFVTLRNPPAPPPPAIIRTFVIKESQRGDLDTGIDVRIGDRITVSANGEIYAGVWFTGNNTAWGWDWRADDPKFPHNNTDDAHPFSLIGKIGIGPYFLVGETLDRFLAQRAGRFLLRINDDTPGNGCGNFYGDIRVHRE
jgi:hypothetical protein